LSKLKRQNEILPLSSWTRGGDFAKKKLEQQELGNQAKVIITPLVGSLLRPTEDYHQMWQNLKLIQ